MQYQVLLHGPYAYLTAADYQKGKMFHGPLMQWTGLQDKNGEEIYEGDIIKNGVATFPVEFSESEAGEYDEKFYGYHFGGPASSDIEVIDNIYENPELLD